MKSLVAACVCGIIFGVGLVVSGMTLPAKVIGFLDIAGDWDPALAFVMVGAIGVHALTRPLVLKRATPVVGERFPGPSPTVIDARLLGGAATFGLGWGLAGFCPGPAIVSTLTGGAAAPVFVVTMLIGMLISQQTLSATPAKTIAGSQGQ